MYNEICNTFIHFFTSNIFGMRAKAKSKIKVWKKENILHDFRKNAQS